MLRSFCLFLLSIRFLALDVQAGSELENHVIGKGLKFPLVSHVAGQVTFKTPEMTRSLKAGEVLNELSFELITGPKAQVRLEISPDSSITLQESSQLAIPFFNRETGEISELNLKSGQARVELGASEHIVTTPVTRDAYHNSDFLLSYDVSRATAVCTVFNGPLDFRGVENEIQARVGPGEQVKFVGILESGQPSFDILLQGRKVARGQLSAVSSLSEKDLAVLTKLTWIQKPPPPKPKAKPKPGPGQICEEPFAKFNECVWRCVGGNAKAKTCAVKSKNVQCVRERCSANGEWSDRAVLPAGLGPCESWVQGQKSQVGVCDY